MYVHILQDSDSHRPLQRERETDMMQSTTDGKGYAPMFGVNLHGTGCKTVRPLPRRVTSLSQKLFLVTHPIVFYCKYCHTRTLRILALSLIFSFFKIYQAFEALQLDSPKKAALYDSGFEYRAHLTKHHRRPDAPSAEYDQPITESQKIGWEIEQYQRDMWAGHDTFFCCYEFFFFIHVITFFFFFFFSSSSSVE